MLKELNQVIDYIEGHLTADITLEEISDYFSFTQMDEENENYAYSEIWMPVRKKG